VLAPARQASHLLEQLSLRVATKRLATGQQFIEHDTETEDVASAINPVPFATGLFRTHVGRRPGILWSLADVLFPECQAKNNDVRLTVVAVHKPLQCRDCEFSEALNLEHRLPLFQAIKLKGVNTDISTTMTLHCSSGIKCYLSEPCVLFDAPFFGEWFVG
jgi:hypothetical protein